MNALGIFVKQPLAGRVKTRLGEAIGDERAAQLYAAFTADMVDAFRGAGDRRTLCYAPDDPAAEQHFQFLAGDDYGLWPQPSAPLGERMAAFFEHSFRTGAERVVVVGSDSPTLPREFIEDAFRQLADHDCVLGPSVDGGYVLVGQRSRTHPIFENIEWSSSRVLDSTVACIEECGCRLALLPPWYDVDTAQDLDLLRGHLRAMRHAGADVTAPQTEQLLKQDTTTRRSSL